MDAIPPSLASHAIIAGRDREVATVRERLADALNGRGSLLLVSGEAGAGKSALAAFLAHEASAAGACVLAGYCYDYAETPPYGPWLEGLSSPANPSFGPSPQRPSTPEVSPALGQDAFFTDVRKYLALLALEQPLVVVLEDLHWADAASLDLLRSVARGLAGIPMLVIVTYRADELDRGHPLVPIIPLLVREALVERVDLRPLDRTATRALIQHRYDLAVEAANRLATHVMQRSEGNALFMVELLRTLEEEQALVLEGGRWQLGQIPPLPVPLLLQHIIDARLARLGDAAVAFLAIAAVIGQEVPLRAWATVALADEETLVPLVERAHAAHLVQVWANGEGFRFTHALIREVLYDGILPIQRKHLHQRIGEFFTQVSTPDPDAVAYHFQQAGDPRAVVWLVQAAERAQDTYALSTAVDRYHAAFLLLDQEDGNASERGWLRLLAAALHHHQEPYLARDWVDQALVLAAQADDTSLRARAQAMRGLLRAYHGELHDGISDLTSATAQIHQLPPGTGTGLRRERHIDQIANQGTTIAFLAYTGRLTEARQAAEQLLAESRDSSPPVIPAGAIADALSGLSLVYALQGDVARASSTCAAAVAAYASIHHHLFTLSKQREALSLIVIPYQADDLPLRERAAAEAERATQELVVASTHGEVNPRYARLSLLILEGHWQEAWELAMASDQWNFLKQMHHLNFVIGVLARAQGDGELAWQCVRNAWPDGAVTEPGNQFVQFTVPLLLTGSALALDHGDLATARTWLDAHERWLDWMGATQGRADGQALEAEWSLAAGDLTRARERAERALALASAPHQPLALLTAHRLLGAIDTRMGRVTHAADHLATALVIADSCRAPYERALVLIEQAELAVAMGDLLVASTVLNDARAICTSLVAKPALTRIGAISARLDDIGCGAISTVPVRLTKRESEVLALLAIGQNNREIAATLFLSPRTVERHITSLYRKIGARHRADAVAYALRHDAQYAVTVSV